MKVNSVQSNGRIGRITNDDGTNTIPIRVEFFGDDGHEWCEPERLTKVDDMQTRKFCKYDKVRYVPRGREDYCSEPDEDKIYEVCGEGERSLGWVDLKGHGYSNCVKWFDLELVEPVKEQPYYVKTGVVYRRNDDMPVATASFTNLGKEKAELLSQMVCDKLNAMEA